MPYSEVKAIPCADGQQIQETAVLLKGALNQDNQFVDEPGKAYDIVINETTAALLNMPRQPIEIKGSLWEHDGKEQLNMASIRPAHPKCRPVIWMGQVAALAGACGSRPAAAP